MNRITNGLTEEEQIAYTQLVFRTVSVDDQARLKRGMQLREEMHAAMARGEDPEGYRVDWLKRTSDRIIKVLIGSSEEFNAIYADDKISLGDLSDVITAVVGRLGLHEDEPPSEVEDLSFLDEEGDE